MIAPTAHAKATRRKPKGWFPWGTGAVAQYIPVHQDADSDTEIEPTTHIESSASAASELTEHRKKPILLLRQRFLRAFVFLVLVFIVVVLSFLGIVLVSWREMPKRTQCDFLLSAKAHHGNTTPNATFAIVTLFGGAPQQNHEMLQISAHNKDQYAAKHGYQFIDASDSIDHTRPAAWSKLLAVQHQLDNFDFVMWLDADVVIMNMNIKLEWIVQEAGSDWDVLITSDLHGPNTGAFIVRSTEWSKWFLHEWWSQKHLSGPQVHFVFEYEQRGLHFMLDTAQWRNQFWLTPAPHYEGNCTEIATHFAFAPQCAFNSYPLDYVSRVAFNYVVHKEMNRARFVDGDFLVHFAGIKGAHRVELMKEYFHHQLAGVNIRS